MSVKARSSGSPPTLWCSLIVAAGPSGEPPLSITSGYSVPWARNSAPSIRAASSAKHSMKACPIRLPLLLRIGDAGQGLEKTVLGMHDVQVGLEVVRELLDHRLRLVLPQQAVVDQDARDLRADGLGQQGGDDRAIDPAGKTADHSALAHAIADGLDRLAGEVADLPRARALADRLEEVAQDLLAQRRVRDLGMELQAVDRQRAMLHRGDRGRCRWRPAAENRPRPARPGRRGSSRPADPRGTPAKSSSSLTSRQWARPYSRAGALSTRPPRASQASCMP